MCIDNYTFSTAGMNKLKTILANEFIAQHPTTRAESWLHKPQTVCFAVQFCIPEAVPLDCGSRSVLRVPYSVLLSLLAPPGGCIPKDVVWSGIVGTATKLQDGLSGGWIPVEARDISLFPKVQDGSGAHPATCLTLRLLMSYIYIYIYIWSTYSWCF